MPNRNLTPHDDVTTIREWLEENLQGPIIPLAANLNDPQLKVKGIYFWFLREDGYKQFSKYISVAPVSPRYEKINSGEIYHLVYLGQAGVRDTGKETNNGNLLQRLLSHISANQNKRDVCKGFMSTFRRTLASLLSDDLLLNNVQNDLSEILEKYFIVYFVPYIGKLSDVRSPILSDEDLLIHRLRPLFNLMGNPNAGINGHITHLIQARRRLIETATKIRLNCLPGKSKSGKRVASLPVTPTETTKVNQSKTSSRAPAKAGCITFRVKKEESIHDVLNQRNDLPRGLCRVRIYNAARPDELVYANTRLEGWRFTGKGKQNIKTFFNAPDTKEKVPRWKVVMNIMNSNPVIDEVIVEVCPAEGHALPTATSRRKTPPPMTGATAIASEEKVPVSNEVYLIPCSSSKMKLDGLKKVGRQSTLNQLEFDKIIGAERKHLIVCLTKASTHIRGRKRIRKQRLNLNFTLEAKDLYSSGKLFMAGRSTAWSPQQAKSVYIISALFGIIRADDFIPLYNLAMNDKLNTATGVVKPNDFWSGKLDEAIKILIDSHAKVYNLLSADYEKVISSNVLNLLAKPPIRLTKRDRSNAPSKRGKWLAKQFGLQLQIKGVGKIARATKRKK